MQTSPQLNPKDISKIYSRYYPRQNLNLNAVKKTGSHIPRKLELWRKGLGGICHFYTKSGEKVLDVGSGVGHSLLQIEKLGGEAWGIDPDNNAQIVAKKLNLKFHKGFIENCPFPKNYFDLITASQVIEHVHEPLNFLKECRKFLKPNGRILISTPNTSALYKKIWGRKWLHWHIPYHLNHFSRKPLQKLAEKAGLKVTWVKTITPNLWTTLQIKSWLNNPKEGTRDLMWDGIKTSRNIKEKKHLTLKGEMFLLSLFEKALFLNRVIDILGLGENLVIELRRK